MKYKIILFVIAILFTQESNSQSNNWIKNKKRILQQNQYIKSLQKSIDQIDPKTYLVDQINENFNLNQYINNIDYKYEQLKITVHNHLSLYNSTTTNFANEFEPIKFANNPTAYLEKGEFNLKNPVPIYLGNEKYSVLKKDDLFVALSDHKMPLNENLAKIITASYWANQTKTLNEPYLKNLKNFAKLNGEFYGYLLVFYDACLQIFNSIDQIGYAGITASQLIDEYSKILGYGFSISATQASFMDYRSSLKEMQNISQRIEAGCNTFLISKHKFITHGKANYNDVENSLKGFKSISDDINTLADNLAKQKNIIRDTRQGLSKLSSFYGISFLEGIGNLYKYLEDYFAMLEDGTRSHANNFDKYVENINKRSNQYYTTSRNIYDGIINKQISKELTYINDYITVQKVLNKIDIKLRGQNNYISYMNSISALNTKLMTAKEIDFIEFHNIKEELVNDYNNFPLEDAQRYYTNILYIIMDKQIVGGNYLEFYSNEIKLKLASIKEDKSKIKEIITIGETLNTFNQRAIMYNNIFYVALGVLILRSIFILTIVYIDHPRKPLSSIQ